MADKRSDGVRKVMEDLGSCMSYHDAFVERIIESERAFLSIIKQNSDANSWQSKLHPPWVGHIVENAGSALMEEKLAFKIHPQARFYEEGEYARAANGALAHERLSRDQMKGDRLNEKQRPLVLQALIAGLTGTKTAWRRELVNRKKLEMRIEFIDGLPYPKLVEVKNVEPVYEGPCTEVLNMEDFFWHEAATSQDRLRFLIHRIWMSEDDLRKLQRNGVFSNVEDVVNPDGKGGLSDPPHPREWEEHRNRVKDLYAVYEHWDMEKRKVTWVCDNVLLRERDFPFFHGGHPFTLISLQPFPFRLDTQSIVEKLTHLQEALWDLMNQRHDNLKLMSNFITAVGPMVDLNALQYKPGARWPVEDVNQVLPIKIDPTPAQLSLPAEQMLMQQLQNLASVQPFSSTSEASNIGADTATEAALVTSLAQLATKRMKEQLFAGYERIGQMRIELNQQFIRKPIYVEHLGLDNSYEIMEILPEMLQGSYRFDITPMSESLMRQEKKAEANTFLTIMAQVAPVAAATGVPINFQAVLEYVFEQYELEPKERFFSKQPQNLPMNAANSTQQAVTPGVPPMGVTAQQSIAPEVSPSNQASVSPETMLQRNMAFQGAGQNGGNY